MLSEDKDDSNTEKLFNEPVIVSNEATHVEKRPRTKPEKFDYVKRAMGRTAIINSIQTQNQAILNREADDEIDFFFKSMAISVKKLPAKGKTEAKLQILTLVSQLEQKYLEPTAQPTQVLFQIPSQQNHSLLSLSSSPSPCPSTSSGASQGFESYNMSTAYGNNYNYNNN
jgi:hypothetical protein